MLSVIIPTEGVEQPAVATLAALVPGAAAGIIREVLLVDRAGNGVIERVADVAGCRFLSFEGTRAAALAAGARAARSPWLMFLHAGAVLDNGWIEETTQFIQNVSSSDRPRAGVFRYARSPYADTRLRDGFKFVARMITGPSAEQGLLIARDHYERLGGYAAGLPPFRDAAVAPARPFVAHPVAQPDHGRRLEAPQTQNIENNPMQSRTAGAPRRMPPSEYTCQRQLYI